MNQIHQHTKAKEVALSTVSETAHQPPLNHTGNPRMSSFVYLSVHERWVLNTIYSSPVLRPATRRRARILLMADRGRHSIITDLDISECLGISRATVAITRKRYAKFGLIQAVTPWAIEAEKINTLTRGTSSYYTPQALLAAGK